MAGAHQFENATFDYDAMAVGIGGVPGDVVEPLACRSIEKPLDVRGPAPGNRDPSCPKPRQHEIEAWEPPGPCPRRG